VEWDKWLRAWAAHATTLAFKRRLDTAKQVSESGAKHGKMYCALSGGKDSVAMAGVLDEVGLSGTVPSVHAHTALDYPDTMSVVNAVADRLDLELIVREPDDLEKHVKRIAKKYGTTPPQPSVSGYDEWDLLRALPHDIDTHKGMEEVGKAISSGNMLIAYMYEAELDGAFVGIRAEESRARTMYFRRWGYSHDFKDGTRNVTPLLAWTGMDVYAYLVSRELPIHPYYRKAYEVFHGQVETPMMVRVDLGVPPAFPSSVGAATMIARVYPEFWRKLTLVRPDMRHYE